MDKENPAVSSAVTKTAMRLVGPGSPKSEPTGAAASPARNKAKKQRGNDYRGNQSRRPLSPVDVNILQPSSQQPAPSEEMAARARQSLNIDQEEDVEDEGNNDNDLQQQSQLLLGSKILAAEAPHGHLSSSLSLSKTTSEGAEGEAVAVMDPEKAMQGAWRPQDPSSDLTDDFEIFCDETQCSYRAPEPIHALHGFPAPGPAPVQQGCAPKSLCSQQLDFQADFPAQPIDDEQFEDQNGPIVRRKTPSDQEIGARALQSLHIDNEDDGKFEGFCDET